MGFLGILCVSPLTDLVTAVIVVCYMNLVLSRTVWIHPSGEVHFQLLSKQHMLRLRPKRRPIHIHLHVIEPDMYLL